MTPMWVVPKQEVVNFNGEYIVEARFADSTNPHNERLHVTDGAFDNLPVNLSLVSTLYKKDAPILYGYPSAGSKFLIKYEMGDKILTHYFKTKEERDDFYYDIITSVCVGGKE